MQRFLPSPTLPIAFDLTGSPLSEAGALKNEKDDPLAAAKGIIIGLGIAAPVWLGIGLLVWLS